MPVGPDDPIAREIRAARAYSGKSRRQIADEIGVKAGTIGNWERGKFTRPPAQAMLSAIARCTKVPARFELVLAVAPTRPSVAERARLAAQRLAGTQEASPGTGDVRDAGSEET